MSLIDSSSSLQMKHMAGIQLLPFLKELLPCFCCYVAELRYMLSDLYTTGWAKKLDCF